MITQFSNLHTLLHRWTKGVSQWLNKSHQLFRLLGYLLSTSTLLLIALGLTGQIIRDCTVEWGLLMYIPLLPLGLWAILLDLLYIGRSLPKVRFGLTFIGLSIVISSSISMIGLNASQIDTLPDGPQPIRFLHWNVRWGGKAQQWKSIRQDISQRHPDIFVISEPPSEKRLQILLKQLGNHWHLIYHNPPLDSLAVTSPWPLQLERLVKFRNGVGMIVTVTLRDHTLRILAIDGERNMSKRLLILSHALLPRWRTPLLKDIVKILVVQQLQGQPIDIIAGDFNALSRSRGFDAFTQVAGGYQLAANFSEGQWRGTWMSWLPLYDIDHVWIHKRLQPINTELFTNLASDHRGQLVQFRMN